MERNKRIIEMPYGGGVTSCSIPPGHVVHILRPAAQTGEGGRSEAEIIRDALANPIAAPRLSEGARSVGRGKVVIVTSDHTRPLPSHLTLPPLLEEIRSSAPKADVEILIGVGCHRGTTREEMLKKFGPQLVASERIANHDPRDPSQLVSLGSLPSGGELVLNRRVVEADLVVADGFIEPHQFAGFSGGRKSILPGVAGLSTVLASHNAEFTVHPKARPGSLDGNPFHEDMLHAARAAGLSFILNVALSPAKRVVAAFAGDMEAAHLAGCSFILEHSGVDALHAPIVITSNGGYPLDQNLYQATKSIMTADLLCEPGGVIIAVNECRDGHGADEFYRDFQNARSLKTLLAEIEARGRTGTKPEQWVTQLVANILLKRTVIFVSELPRETVENFGMRYAKSMTEALETADRLLGRPDAPIAVLPDAVSLIVR